MRVTVQILRISIHLLRGMWLGAAVFAWLTPAARMLRIQRWSRQLLAICRVEVEVVDAAETGIAGIAARALIVSNHVSWLDIFVINTLQPCRFVAKSDIRDWPLIGWLSSKAGTIFITRGNRRDVRRIFTGLVDSIRAGEKIAFFPEGTTSVQGQLLPFHANLFEAAIDAGVPVQPYALRYFDAAGRYQTSIEFVGDMTFVQSILAIVRSGKIRAQLIVLPVIATEGVLRRQLAQTSWEAMAQALASADVDVDVDVDVTTGPTCPASDVADTAPAAACGLPGTQH